MASHVSKSHHIGSNVLPDGSIKPAAPSKPTGNKSGLAAIRQKVLPSSSKTKMSERTAGAPRTAAAAYALREIDDIEKNSDFNTLKSEYAKGGSELDVKLLKQAATYRPGQTAAHRVRKKARGAGSPKSIDKVQKSLEEMRKGLATVAQGNDPAAALAQKLLQIIDRLQLALQGVQTLKPQIQNAAQKAKQRLDWLVGYYKQTGQIVDDSAVGRCRSDLDRLPQGDQDSDLQIANNVLTYARFWQSGQTVGTEAEKVAAWFVHYAEELLTQVSHAHKEEQYKEALKRALYWDEMANQLDALSRKPQRNSENYKAQVKSYKAEAEKFAQEWRKISETIYQGKPHDFNDKKVPLNDQWSNRDSNIKDWNDAFDDMKSDGILDRFKNAVGL